LSEQIKRLIFRQISSLVGSPHGETFVLT